MDNETEDEELSLKSRQKSERHPLPLLGVSQEYKDDRLNTPRRLAAHLCGSCAFCFSFYKPMQAILN